MSGAASAVLRRAGLDIAQFLRGVSSFVWLINCLGTAAQQALRHIMTMAPRSAISPEWHVHAHASPHLPLAPCPQATLTGLSPGTTYFCYVQASNGINPVSGANSLCTPPRSVTTHQLPPKPSQPALSDVEATRLKADWAESSPIGVPEEAYLVRWGSPRGVCCATVRTCMQCASARRELVPALGFVAGSWPAAAGMHIRWWEAVGGRPLVGSCCWDPSLRRPLVGGPCIVDKACKPSNWSLHM